MLWDRTQGSFRNKTFFCGSWNCPSSLTAVVSPSDRLRIKSIPYSCLFRRVSNRTQGICMVSSVYLCVLERSSERLCALCWKLLIFVVKNVLFTCFRIMSSAGSFCRIVRRWIDNDLRRNLEGSVQAGCPEYSSKGWGKLWRLSVRVIFFLAGTDIVLLPDEKSPLHREFVLSLAGNLRRSSWQGRSVQCLFTDCT